MNETAAARLYAPLPASTRPETWLDLSMQATPASARWVCADELLWEGVLRQEPVRRGTRGRALFQVMRVAASLGLAVAAVWLIGALGVIRLVLRQRRVARAPNAIRSSICVCVGFGARAEAGLLAEYRSMATADVIHVDQTDASAWRIGRARFRDVWRSFTAAIGDVHVAMAALPDGLRDRLPDALAAAAKRIGEYAFSRALWKDIQRRFDLREACFLAADVNAFAAVSEGVHAIYLQHGLLSRSLWFPEFSEVYPVTRYEGAYLSRRLPLAIVHASRKRPSASSGARMPRLVVASGHRTAEEMMLVAPLAKHLAQHGVTTHVRLFHGEDVARFWGSAMLGVPCEVAADPGSFDQLLDALQPSFVASWASTALPEALCRGIIPICVARSDDRGVQETVYPLRDCCLKWPEDKDAVENALSSHAAYEATLNHLRRQEGLYRADRSG